MTIRDMVKKVMAELSSLAFEDVKSESQWLIAESLNISKSRLLLDQDQSLSLVQIEMIEKACLRRKTGEPLSYIVGRRDFYGRTFLVGPGVLIPRPETELIIDLAKKHFAKKSQSISIADWGAGSGCIGLTLLQEFENSKLTSVEMSEAAAIFLRRNSKNLNCDNRHQILQGKVQEQTYQPSFDLIVANPPYIDQDDIEVAADVRQFEPAEALFSSDHGLKDAKDWISAASKALMPNGVLLMEIGARQWENLKNLPWASLGFSTPEIFADLAGWPRVIKAEKSTGL